MSIHIDPRLTTGTISPYLHGQFIEFLGECIDQGLWVGTDSSIPNTDGIRTDALKALKALKPPLLRWPGGCYADTYHWRQGVGPRDQRPVGYNENFGTYQPDGHGFGTDEFLRLCQAVGAEPWINVNMLSGSVAEMRDWMEYCNRPSGTAMSAMRAANGHPSPYGVKFWGLGNEPWAGGGTMTPSMYADRYRMFASAMPTFAENGDQPPMIRPIACGPDGNKPMERVRWTRDFFQALAQYRQPPIAAYDLHFYNWNIDHPDDTSTQFDQDGWDRVIRGALELGEVIDQQWNLMQACLATMPYPESSMDSRLTKVDLVMGEWGNWHGDAFTARPALRQQVTMRDAVTSALTLDILQSRCDKVSMACNAQTLNVLNSLILTEDDATILTPNYDVFMMYRRHQGARAIQILPEADNPALHVFASVKDGHIMVDLVNADMASAAEAALTLPEPVRPAGMQSLSAQDPHACNTRSDPDQVRARQVDVSDIPEGREITVRLDPASVNVLDLTMV